MNENKHNYDLDEMIDIADKLRTMLDEANEEIMRLKKFRSDVLELLNASDVSLPF